MAFDHIVHHFTKVPDTNLYSITRVTPLIRLGSRDGSVYLQEGKILTEGGDIVTDPPEWFWDEIAKLTPLALHEVGFKEAPVRPNNATAKVGGPETRQADLNWQCPDCGRVVATEGKEQHIAAHNRKRSADNQMKG